MRAALRSLVLAGAALLAGAPALAADAGTVSTKATRKTDKTDKTAAPAKKKASKKKKAAAAEAPAAHRRIGASPAYVVGDTDAHLINESGPPLEPFPTDSKAVKKAFAETRRDQIADAEKAARDERTPDRWRTVLFMLRGLPERTDPEACFWRVLSFYRLGEIQRARTLREGCDLPGKDSATLNGEDALAAGVPAMGTVAADDGFGTSPGTAGTGAPAAPKPAPPTAPYTGPGPQHR